MHVAWRAIVRNISYHWRCPIFLRLPNSKPLFAALVGSRNVVFCSGLIN